MRKYTVTGEVNGKQAKYSVSAPTGKMAKKAVKNMISRSGHSIINIKVKEIER